MKNALFFHSISADLTDSHAVVGGLVGLLVGCSVHADRWRLKSVKPGMREGVIVYILVSIVADGAKRDNLTIEKWLIDQEEVEQWPSYF